ncbi:MAG: enoyl-CoA hydratase-related protein [Chloroflexi bacterium]|nr:enoyl-CoA hydratase-related protein [Chloroflexota bacterium]
MSDYENVRYERVGRVARVTLDRPRYRNAQSRRLLEELDHALARANDDREVGVITVWGAGDHFSAGHDLGTPEQRADMEARPPEEGLRGRYAQSWDNNVDKSLRWRNLPKPTIAAVQGYCIFGGWIIASAMDLIFAADDAMFLGTNFQYFSIPWDLHARQAKELLFESRFVGAAEAKELGLVNRVVAREQLDDEVMAYAERVAENDPFQLRMIKLAINQAQDAQGFTGHINGAFALHLLSSTGEGDPGFALKKPMDAGQRRRPMVERAMQNFELERSRREGETGSASKG